MYFLKTYNKSLKNLSSFFNSSKKYTYIIIGFLTLFPMLLISFFNNPASDDYDYEFKRSFQEIIQTQIELYQNWSGRYFSIGFMAINPDFFIKYSLFKFYPIFIFFLFIISLILFFKSIFSEESNLKILSIVSIFIFIFLIQIPDNCQAFFWYSSSICYQFGNVLFLFFISFFIKYKKSKKVGYLILSIIFVIASIGSNEILMLILLFLTIFYLLIKYHNSKKIELFEIIFSIIILLFSLLVIFAPGNEARLIREIKVENSHNLFLSLSKTIFYSLKYFVKWTPIILLTIYLLKNKIFEITFSLKSNFFVHPSLCLLLLGLLFIPSFFIGFWEKDYLLPDRAINSIYFFFVLIMFYTAGCFMFFYKDKLNFLQKSSLSQSLILTVVLLLFALSDTPISNAYFDLFSGKAYKYNEDLKIRNQIINASISNFVQVPMLINRPETIYNSEVMGLTTDKNNWKNVEVSKYYKKSIVIIPLNSVISE